MKKPYFPMFVDLSGRQVTVVGGGSVALRRSETLLYFGVDIKVIAPEIRSEFYRLDSEQRISGRGCKRSRSCDRRIKLSGSKPPCV